MKKKIVIVSGYFNPIHIGHIIYLNKAKACGDYLCVIVNNDKQRALKGSKEFMNEEERLTIIENIKSVDFAILSVDQDRTVVQTIKKIYDIYVPLWSPNCSLAFANGGDQNNNSIPEKEICDSLGIELIDGLGSKVQSSSWLLKKL